MQRATRVSASSNRRLPCSRRTARSTAKIQEQRDAIAFYRGIVSPADGRPGLRVQDFRLTRGAEERQFNLRLVLVQAMKHDRKVSGDVTLSVEGIEGGVARTYAMTELLLVNQLAQM